MSVQIHDPVDDRQQLHVCLLPDFHLNLKTTTLLGSRAKLQGTLDVLHCTIANMSDIPKLEQLIMTRFRSIIQDRLVHPNHLTLTLPRLQATQQGIPIVTDLGQRAVEAVREGISKAASDFVNLGPIPNSLEPDLPQSALQSQSQSQPQSQLPSPSASPPIGRKRIPMPAGFPGYSSSAMDSPALTPTPRGESRRSTLPPQLPAFAQPQGQPRRPQPTTQSSAHRTPGLATTGRTSSLAPSNSRDGDASGAGSNSQFRFRGQFASQPPTPSVGDPRVGALNSRAP
jgi:maintenance of morphology protein 1